MINSFILSYLCFILLFQNCTAPKTYRPTGNAKSQNQRRDRISEIVKHDLCSERMWPFMSPKKIRLAKKQCEEAYNLFAGLPSQNQAACLNAASPDCRPIEAYENLFYGCSFVCDITGPRWRTDALTGISVQEWLEGQEIRHLEDIVNQYSKKVEKKRKARTNIKRKDDPDNPSGSKKSDDLTTSNLVQ